MKSRIGIRPTIDGRWGGIREGLEEQTMGMAKAAKALIEQNVNYADGSAAEVVISPCTIGGGAEAARCAEYFRQQNVAATLTVTPCWCYGSETMDLDPTTRDWWKMAIAKDYKKDAGYYAEVSSSLGQNASGVSDSIRTINGILSDINKAQAELADAVAGVNKNLQEITYSSENMSAETKGVLQSIGRLQENMQQFRV